ncbi:MAG: FMN-binding protein [Fibrobacteres bacterium]|nr:FMN-binding protein [Fibrobacterota bacterium]
MPDVGLDARMAEKARLALHRIFGAASQATPDLLETKYGKRPAWRIRAQGGGIAGAAMVDEVPGKSERITILVASGPDGRLMDLEVLAYRESYGGEVAQDAWRAQFRGKKPGEPLKVGRQIRNISGATISTNSVSAGVARCLPVLAGLVGVP